MQLGVKGTLQQLIGDNEPFDEKTCKTWFAQMLSAMSCMHKKGIAHRDLKLSNILLDESHDILISDFGLSRLVWRESVQELMLSKTYCGTVPYMAPEILNIKETSNEVYLGYNAKAADVWALGVSLYYLFNKDYPFKLGNKYRAKAIKKMNEKSWDFNNRNSSKPSDDLRDILTVIFEPNVNLRPTVEKLTHHKWVSDEYKEVEKKIFLWKPKDYK